MEFYFSLKRDSAFREFNGQCILIHFLGKSTTKSTMDFHSSTYNVVGFMREYHFVAVLHIRKIRNK